MSGWDDEYYDFLRIKIVLNVTCANIKFLEEGVVERNLAVGGESDFIDL